MSEDRLEQIHKQKKEKQLRRLITTYKEEERHDISGNPIGRFDVDMKDIIRKALMMRLGKPQDLTFIQHISPLRGHRHRHVQDPI